MSLVARTLSQAPAQSRAELASVRDDAWEKEQGPARGAVSGLAARSGRDWRHFAAGGCGGMMGALITCPLEVVKTHLQSKNVLRRSLSDVVLQIARIDGVLGFWRGIGPMLAGVVPARAVNFWTYNAVKGYMLSTGHADGPLVHVSGACFLSPGAVRCKMCPTPRRADLSRCWAGGIVAGVTTVTVINPVWVIKTRLQLQGAAQMHAVATAGEKTPRRAGGVVYRGSFDAFRQILREEGVLGFYKGLIPSIWGVSETAIQFVLYEHLKSMLAHRHSKGVHSSSSMHTSQQIELHNFEYIGAAASAKVVASCSTYPHEVIRTRLRERGASKMYNSAIHCVQRVWVEEGVRGLYGGLGTHLLRVIPNTAILFFTYEKVSRFLSSSATSS